MKKDIDLALMAGIDVPIPNLQLIVHSPTIKDIAFMGESNFFTAIQYLCIDKESFSQDENVLSNLSNFQVLMKVLESPESKRHKQLVHTLLMLLFPNSQIMIMPRSINIMTDDQVVMLDDNNFDDFQSAIKNILCVNNLFQGGNVVYNPKGAKAKAIADKIMKSRQKIAKQKGSSETGSSIFVRYLSILRVGAQIPLSESIEYNLFQLFDQMERYNAYVEWDVDLRVRLAGGEPKQQVETWMRNLYSMK